MGASGGKYAAGAGGADMTITTEKAEELAKAAFGLMDDPPDPDDEIMLGSDFLVDLAATIRSLAAERDSLQARVAELEGALLTAKQHFVADEPLKAFVEICAALEGKKDE